MNDTYSTRLQNIWSTANNTGLDSYADNLEVTQQKFALVSAALKISAEENYSAKARNALKEHFIRLQEAVSRAE